MCLVNLRVYLFHFSKKTIINKGENKNIEPQAFLYYQNLLYRVLVHLADSLNENVIEIFFKFKLYTLN